MTIHFVKRSPIDVSARELYDWHMRPGAFEKLVPPWQDVRLLEQTGPAHEEGTRLFLSVPFGPIRRLWVAEHRDIIEGRQFVDVQIQGPFARWEHTHRFLEREGGRSYLEDAIELELPFGALGEFVGRPFVTSQLERVFAYRHRVTADDLRESARAGASDPEAPARGRSATDR